MVLKFKNNISDVEILVEYRYLNLFFVKIYRVFMCIIGILVTMAIFIKFIIDNYSSYSYIFMTIIFILITPAIILLSVYLHFRIIPKLIVNRFKKDATNIYRNNNQFFSAEKIITIKDESIEVAYNNKKLNIKIRKSIFIDEFKGYIIITDIFMKNKVRKIYPLVIPINIFESEEDKKKFITNIKNTTC